MVNLSVRARLPLTVLPGLAMLLVATPAAAQTQGGASAAAKAATAADSAKEPGLHPRSAFGTTLSRAEARALLGEMQQLTRQALARSRAAERAASVADIKAAAGEVRK
jgi:regulator of sirC expression with transglutaminase-like and TPR domain